MRAQRPWLRDLAGPHLRSARPRCATEPHHHRPAAGASQRPRPGRVCDHFLTAQVRRHGPCQWRAVVDAVPRRRTRPGAGQPAGPLPREQDLPQDLRDLRRGRIQCPLDDGGADAGGFAHAPAALPGCVLARNPVPEKAQMAALAHALVQWVAQGVAPPPSRYPRLADGDLAPNTAHAMGWPAIPGVPGPDGMAIGLMAYDYGPGR